MGRVRRGGHIVYGFKGDHPPKHVHFADKNGKFLGRITVKDARPLDDWQPPRAALRILEELKREGRI